MPSTVVPVLGPDVAPIDGLEDLIVHLDKLVADPETKMDPRLFDSVELQLAESNIPPLLPCLLPKLTEVLKTTPHDPAVPVALTIKLLGPVSFPQTLALADEDSLIAALSSPAPSAKALAMTILHKAAASPSDVAHLAAMPTLLSHFLHTWLATPQVEIGEKGSRVLGDLLDTDATSEPLHRPSAGAGPITIDGVTWVNGTSNRSNNNNATEARHLRPRGTGALWNRLFHDPTLYTHLYALPRGKDTLPGAPGHLSAHQTTLAQGRILRILPRLAALDFRAVTQPPQPTLPSPPAEVEVDTSIGLLQFAALRMVDKEDVLMHRNLVHFFDGLLSLLRLRADMDGPEKDLIVRTASAILAEATADDPALRDALRSLPERTVPEEADGLRAFVELVLS
ncbi:hypothetical protein SODALDRAFT_4235 [Sodiomyces alkalinus F11]|uniref:DNA mismatch repair protein HSM3 N-terminal domain-containing protein n=1 Tax=Sodiomyces alkalinus (strain CBS 110278 / VKM F-3762 / F11) TaxID=1314773 RepID=A0A3N2Q5A6_SODAK|nr:hypothetical protein SODALDRAFT_4235 [Sodiomyces alkalinus F11]ROT41959.1 hypothetical protein SODALDRAFT_4235 [Sodiomyces alkalinus F11]